MKHLILIIKSRSGLFLKNQLQKESHLVKEESKAVLAEFEKLDNDDQTI